MLSAWVLVRDVGRQTSSKFSISSTYFCSRFDNTFEILLLSVTPERAFATFATLLRWKTALKNILTLIFMIIFGVDIINYWRLYYCKKNITTTFWRADMMCVQSANKLHCMQINYQLLDCYIDCFDLSY